MITAAYHQPRNGVQTSQMQPSAPVATGLNEERRKKFFGEGARIGDVPDDVALLPSKALIYVSEIGRTISRDKMTKFF
jgi:hypothetical protein